VGPQGFAAWTLTSLTPGLAEGGRVLWVDGSNRFDLHGLARAARARGVDPRAVLSRVDLARPFTAFQLEKLVASVLPSMPDRRPVVLSDPLALFYDPDLPLDDAERLFSSFLGRIAKLERPALVLGLRREAPKERRGFSHRLFFNAAASAVMSLEGRWRLSGGQKALA
jgi:hypothetical protein